MLILLFGAHLRWLPLAGGRTPFARYDTVLAAALDIGRHLILPALTLTLAMVGVKFLLVRNATVTVLRENFMLVARAKGLPEGRLKWGHAFRNAVLPFVAHTAAHVGMAVTGAVFILLREATLAARVVSVDLAHAMLKQAQKRCPDAQLVQTDAHSLPFPSGAFDRVVCHNVLPHFRDRRAALAELARALTPGGILLVLHDVGREQVNAIHQSVGGAIGNDLLPARAELYRLLTESGFSGLEIEDSPNGYWAIGWRSEAGRSRF